MSQTVVAYTFAPWEHALAVLRFVAPLQTAGITLLRGNVGMEVDIEKVSQADWILMQRDFPHDQDAYTQILERAHAEGKPVILDLDDLLLELPENHPDINPNLDSNVLFPILRGLIEVDAVTASTAPLCETLRVFNPNTWLLPNYLIDPPWRLRPPGPAREPGTPVIIAYIGGGSHRPDLEMVAPALLNILERYGPGVRAHFYGVQPPESLLNNPSVAWTALDLRDYAQFASYLYALQADIFIAPLVDNLFNRCKSAVKFLEYSACGTPGIYSRLEPYEHLVDHEVNGLLATTPQEWEADLALLVESPELRHKLGEGAQKTVRSGWLLSQNASTWAQTYGKIGARPVKDHGDWARSLKIVQLGHAWQSQLLERIASQEFARQALQDQLASQEQRIQALQVQIAEAQTSPARKLASAFQPLVAALRRLAPRK
jgi:glycosyltransferase involved in cell wall biosynthesis